MRYSDKSLFMSKYGSLDTAKKLAEHPAHSTRMMALARVHREAPDDPDYKRLMRDHLTKVFETGDRALTSMNMDSPHMTWSHLDTISKHFPETDWRNKDLYARMRRTAMYNKKELDANE